MIHSLTISNDEYDIYTVKQFEEILKLVTYHAITLEDIVKCSHQLAIIGDYGKLDIYKRILFDGAHSN